jgi:hypothetical protein
MKLTAFSLALLFSCLVASISAKGRELKGTAEQRLPKDFHAQDRTTFK